MQLNKWWHANEREKNKDLQLANFANDFFLFFALCIKFQTESIFKLIMISLCIISFLLLPFSKKVKEMKHLHTVSTLKWFL